MIKDLFEYLKDFIEHVKTCEIEIEIKFELIIIKGNKKLIDFLFQKGNVYLSELDASITSIPNINLSGLKYVLKAYGYKWLLIEKNKKEVFDGEKLDNILNDEYVFKNHLLPIKDIYKYVGKENIIKEDIAILIDSENTLKSIIDILTDNKQEFNYRILEYHKNYYRDKNKFVLIINDQWVLLSHDFQKTLVDIEKFEEIIKQKPILIYQNKLMNQDEIDRLKSRTEQEVVNDLIEETLNNLKEKLLVKGKEYIRNNDPFHNFNTGAAITGQTREDIIWGFALKHFISIQDIKSDLKKEIKPNKETLDEKYNDLIVYLLLEKASIICKL